MTRLRLIPLAVLCLGLIGVSKAQTDDAKPGEPETRPNVLLICVDDLRPELNCFGKSYIQSPNIDALAASGRAFHRHYVQAPTCGASRYTLLTGMYGPASNGALFARAKRLAKDSNSVPPSLPAWFRSNGYRTVSIGKVSHHPGGRGGPDWDDESIPEMPNSWDRHLMPVGDWQHPRGSMHGLAHGEIRRSAGAMDVYQSAPGDDSIYPDGLTIDTSLAQMNELTSEGEPPFFLAVGIIRPHLPFGAPAKYMKAYRDVQLPPIPHPTKPLGQTTWHRSGEFMKYNRWDQNPIDDDEFATEVRRHYAACVTYADAMVGRLMAGLRESGAADNTIVILWGDHGWNLGEHAIWGKHCLFEESLRSPLIIRYPDMPDPGVKADGIVETLDLFPTLCDLAGLAKPDTLQGQSLLPLLRDASHPGDPAISYRNGVSTVRTDDFRLIQHAGGHVELYKHDSVDAETVNVAEQYPDQVRRLSGIIESRLGSKSSQ